MGATDWCTHPVDLEVERVRGTKNPDHEAIVRLRPDLVVANREENRRIDVERLGPPGSRCGSRRSNRWIRPSAPCTDCWSTWSGPTSRMARYAAAEWRRPPGSAGPGGGPHLARPWMVVGADTFAATWCSSRAGHRASGGATSGTRSVTWRTWWPSAPDLVLLPDEPYPFSADDGPEPSLEYPPRWCRAGTSPGTDRHGHVP